MSSPLSHCLFERLLPGAASPEDHVEILKKYVDGGPQKSIFRIEHTPSIFFLALQAMSGLTPANSASSLGEDQKHFAQRCIEASKKPYVCENCNELCKQIWVDTSVNLFWLILQLAETWGADGAQMADWLLTGCEGSHGDLSLALKRFNQIAGQPMPKS